MANNLKSTIFFLAVFLFCAPLLKAMENTGRYFPFSQRPEKAMYNKGLTADVDFFYSSGGNIAQEDQAPIGIGEFAGMYDLSGIIFAMDQVNLPTQSIKRLIGQEYLNTPIKFNVHGKLRGGGGVLHYAWAVPNAKMPMTLGASLPFIYVDSDVRYSLDVQSFMQQYLNTIPPVLGGIDIRTVEIFQERMDRARRLAHDAIGLNNNHWNASGFGDLDVFIKANILFEYQYLMRSIDIPMQFGVIMPTGNRRLNNNPASVPFNNDGHWSVYAQIAPIFELKQDLKTGFMVRGDFFMPNTRERQLPIFKESFLYSPLIGRVRVQPGTTFLASAFLAFENVYDGLSLQGRYTYKQHNADNWQDKRDDKTTPSYLSRTVANVLPNGQTVTNEQLVNIISAKEYLSKYRSHYITIQLNYDPQEALLQDRWFNPKFFASIDFPFFSASRGIVQANQISIGAELHF